MEKKLRNFEVINSLIIMSIADIVLTSAGTLVKEINSASLLNAVLISILGIIITFIMCKLSRRKNSKNYYRFWFCYLFYSHTSLIFKTNC